MSANAIRDAIRQLSKSNDEVYSIVCTVDSVDATNRTCDCSPIDGKADLLGVRLMAENSTGLFILPKVNSTVIVTMINVFTGYVAMFSEVEEIQLNGDNYDGLVRISDLVTKLNNLENKVNAIISTYNAHTHITTCGAGAGTASPTPSTVVGTLTPTTQSSIENITVKHGNG
jgi:hypothetical protein